MKNFICCMFLLFTLSTCYTYQTFIQVQEMQHIPDGTRYILLAIQTDSIKQLFNNNKIMTRSFEGGFETEELLIDEGTRAMYKVHTFDKQVRVSAFWGVTQKVRRQQEIWVGTAAASLTDVHSWDMVVYNNAAKRPKRVFDYAMQIIESKGLSYQLQ